VPEMSVDRQQENTDQTCDYRQWQVQVPSALTLKKLLPIVPPPPPPHTQRIYEFRTIPPINITSPLAVTRSAHCLRIVRQQLNF
jgi:hypothetical protein